MDELKGYQHLRLDLADMIRAILHISRAYADAGREHEARQLLARLASGRFRLAIAGQFSRGKTTLMNALLRASYLPMGALPMTSVVTTVRYGSRPRATVRRRGSPLPVDVPLTEVARFVAQASSERAELRVSLVEVEVPAEILRLGFEFADTPGIGSAIEVNTATTARVLPQADAVVVVTGFDSPLTQAEADFLSHTAERAGRLFLVINKRDLVSAQDAVAVAGYVRQWLADHLHLAEPQVFGLSALEALKAAAGNDEERLAASGILALQAALTEFLTADKARTFLDNVADRAASLMAGQRRDLRLGSLAADGGTARHVVAAFDVRIEELSAAELAVAQRIATCVRDRLPGLLAQRGPAWEASLRDKVAAQAGDTLRSDASPDAAETMVADALARLDRAGQEVVPDWLDHRAGEVHELLMGLAAADIGELLELAHSPRVLAATLTGAALADGRSGKTGWSAADVPDLIAPAVEWSVPPPTRQRSRRRRAGTGEAATLLANALSSAVAEFVGNTRSALQGAARDWADRFTAQAGQQTLEAAELVRSYLQTTPREEDVSALGELAVRLASFRASLDTQHPAADRGPAESVAPVPIAHESSCPVCTEMEKTLNEYLRRDQFLLATRESEQARRAQAGGFCPWHTWQYAAIAAPLGIAAGYARLTGAVADALEDISQRNGAEEGLASKVTGLIQASTCPVCAALADREAGEIARFVRAPLTGDPAVLCLRHLALVLGAAPAPGSGQAMVQALSSALRRAAEDMREYALKREAHHSELVTENEATAYAEALRLLVGQQALARPWDTGT